MGLALLLNQIFGKDFAVFSLTIYVLGTIFVTLSFHYLNIKFLQDKKRSGLIAFILSACFSGSGFAYNGAYIRAWFFAVASLITLYLGMSQDNEMMQNTFVILNLVQAFWAPYDATNASVKLRRKSIENQQKAIETNYLQGLLSYIHNGYQVAVDTNFLMHFSSVLLNLFKNTQVHLFVHPTVFAELEGLKGNANREVRARAQGAFDILELFQKGNRMQWTLRQKHGSDFKSADQRIITGVLSEIQNGTKLVFASHDKGAGILARSLNIPVVDPYDDVRQQLKKLK